MLTLIDEYTRECLTVEVGVSIRSQRVKQILQRVCADTGQPELIRSDNGSEFIGKAVGAWLMQNGIKPLFIEPGKPWQNGKGESFNGKLRDECLRDCLKSRLRSKVQVNLSCEKANLSERYDR